MIKVIFPVHTLTNLIGAFRSDTRDRFALILARPVRLGREQWRFLVQSIHILKRGNNEIRAENATHRESTLQRPIEGRAEANGWSVIYCHPAGKGGRTVPSPADETAEVASAATTAYHMRGVPYLSLTIDHGGVCAHVSGAPQEVEVWEIGQRILRFDSSVSSPLSPIYDRQIRAFGEDGQLVIQSLRVGIIGLGGTGSVTAQQLAHLGVRRFLLIDPDALDDTNLNRVVGTTPRDIGRAKVLVAKRMIRRIIPSASVKALRGDVLMDSIGLRLRDVDFVFCCTDSQGSRHFVNQLAYQYLIPCIDMGTVIGTHDGAVTHMDARVQMLAPGLSCLLCCPGILSPEQVRWDLSSGEQQSADPYFSERSGIKQPSVISLNSTAASLAVTMFLGAVAGVPAEARSLRYRGIKGASKIQEATPCSGCSVCSTEGALAAGDSVPLPRRAA